MTYMFEVYYRPPTDPERETLLTRQVAELGGRLDYRDDATPYTGVCLTYEFDTLEAAEAAAQTLREQGEYVEGPSAYGD